MATWLPKTKKTQTNTPRLACYDYPLGGDPYVVLPKEAPRVSHFEAKRLLLTAGRSLFGPYIVSIQMTPEEDLPERLLDDKGDTVAFCWFAGRDGRVEFKPWCAHCAN